MFKLGATAPIPSTEFPGIIWLKSAVTTTGVHTGGVRLPVGVAVGGVTVPVIVGVAGVMVPVGVKVAGVIVPVGVEVGGVIVPVGVEVAGVIVPVGVEVAGVIVPVGVCVGVPACVSARLRKTTIVCEEAFPCTIVMVALRALIFLLSRRFAGIVYTSVTAYPACASSVIVKEPASTVMSAEQAPTGTVFVLLAKLKLKYPLTPEPSASLQI